MCIYYSVYRNLHTCICIQAIYKLYMYARMYGHALLGIILCMCIKI